MFNFVKLFEAEQAFFFEKIPYKKEVKKTVSIGIRLDEALAATLFRVSKQSGIKPSTLARMALEEYLNSVEKTGQLVVKLTDSAKSIER